MFSPYRARMIGTRHMAAAGEYLAAQAALQILEAGGNAIDAGVAGGLMLGVVQSEYVCIGGVAPIMIYWAETDEVITISGLGTWPKLTDVNVFNRDFGGRIPQGLLRSIVPAAMDSWVTALERFGTMSFGTVAASALRYARDGFPAPALMHDIITKLADDYRRWPQNAAIYLPNDQPPQTGELFVQSELAGTIQFLIDEEAAVVAKGRSRAAGLSAVRDAFYKGDIAKAIVRYHEENGGWMRADDLADFRVEVNLALQAHFGDVDVFTCGPWCQGPVLGETLHLLEGFDLAGLGHNSPAYVHVLTEALKLSYADRHELYGDPNFVNVPIETLFSRPYADERRKLIDLARAHPGMPDAGLPTNWRRDPQAPPPAESDPGQIDTSYVCAVDRWGNAFSATPSDGSAGSPLIPGLGFVPSGRGAQNWTDPAAPAVLGPGRRPRLTPAPGFARKRGEWIMPFGSPGNDVQPQAMLQVFLNVLVFGMPPQQAIDQPRFATFSYPRSSSPHSFSPGLLTLESRFDPATIEALRGLGHIVKLWPDWEFEAGGVSVIQYDLRKGMMEGGSDPRRPTAVAGW